jgi:hypothetical protein
MGGIRNHSGLVRLIPSPSGSRPIPGRSPWVGPAGVRSRPTSILAFGYTRPVLDPAQFPPKPPYSAGEKITSSSPVERIPKRYAQKNREKRKLILKTLAHDLWRFEGDCDRRWRRRRRKQPEESGGGMIPFPTLAARDLRLFRGELQRRDFYSSNDPIPHLWRPSSAPPQPLPSRRKVLILLFFLPLPTVLKILWILDLLAICSTICNF